MAQNSYEPATGRSSSNLSNPISQSEIEDLLYDGNLTPAERLARLRDMREDLQIQQEDDTDSADPRSMLMAIDDAIAELEASEEGVEPSITGSDEEPAEELETLSADDDMRASAEAGIEDELSADEDEEAAALSDWDAENDGHDGRNGYH